MKGKMLAVIISAFILTSVGISSTLGSTQDKVPLEKLAKEFVLFEQTFGVFPLDKIDKSDIDDAAIQGMINSQLHRAEHFSKPGSAFYQKLSNLISNALVSQKSRYIRTFDGGVSNVNITSTQINGNSANIDFSYVAHATFAQWQTDHWVKASPSNEIIEHLDFEKDVSGGWNIVNEQWKFAPGSTP